MDTHVQICFEMRDAGECDRFFAYLAERPRAMWDYEERVREKFHAAGLAADFHAHWTHADVLRTAVRRAGGVIAYEATLRAGAKDPSLLVDVLRRCRGLQDGSMHVRWTVGAWYRRGEHGAWTADAGNASTHASADEFCTGRSEKGAFLPQADRAHVGCSALAECAALAARIVERCAALPLADAGARRVAGEAGVGTEAADGGWRLCGEVSRRYEALCGGERSTANKAALCWALWEALEAGAAGCVDSGAGAGCVDSGDEAACAGGLRVVVLKIRVDKHARDDSDCLEQARRAIEADVQRFVAMYREYSSRGGIETLLDRLAAFV